MSHEPRQDLCARRIAFVGGVHGSKRSLRSDAGADPADRADRTGLGHGHRREIAGEASFGSAGTDGGCHQSSRRQHHSGRSGMRKIAARWHDALCRQSGYAVLQPVHHAESSLRSAEGFSSGHEYVFRDRGTAGARIAAGQFDGRTSCARRRKAGCAELSERSVRARPPTHSANGSASSGRPASWPFPTRAAARSSMGS